MTRKKRTFSCTSSITKNAPIIAMAVSGAAAILSSLLLFFWMPTTALPFSFHLPLPQLQKDPLATKKKEPKNRNRIIPVYMVYNRVDYLKQAFQSLRDSDFPKSEWPVVVSHDGHKQQQHHNNSNNKSGGGGINEVQQFIDRLKQDGDFTIVQVFHPYSCADHPHSFPGGNDQVWNRGYAGDTYGNPREAKITCCKHHFTWLMNHVFTSPLLQKADGFLFMEEDYLVSPSVSHVLRTGFEYLDQQQQVVKEKKSTTYFGITLDPTDAGPMYVRPDLAEQWLEKKFTTGPFAMRRDMFGLLQKYGKEYCVYDDYNWDWSIVHLMALRILPYKVLVPGTPQVLHIGVEGGLHHHGEEDEEGWTMNKGGLLPKLKSFAHPVHHPPHSLDVEPLSATKNFGGWGHPMDHEHCIQLFQNATKTTASERSG